MRAKSQTNKSLTRNERVRKSSQKRREEQKDSLRQSILNAAGELFLEKGYEGFSLRQVAERIGYSATTIYRYYENKDDLLLAIVREGFTEFNRQLSSAVQGARTPLKKIEALGETYVNFGMENPVYYQLMFMQRADFLFQSRSAETVPMIDSFNVLQEGVGTAMEAGVIKKVDVETYSYVLWSLMHGIVSLAIANPERFTKEKVKKSLRATGQMLFGKS